MNRPRIIINCAMSADGKIALPSRKQLRISSEEDMERVHILRNTCDAVLVGSGAVLTDDPKLTVKEAYVENVKQPTRIVLDTYCNTPIDALVVNDKAPTILCYHENKEQKTYPNTVELLYCDKGEQHLKLHDVLEKIAQKGIQSILVEGGGTVIWDFLNQRFVDDLYVYVGPMIVGGKHTPTMADGLGIQKEGEAIPLSIKKVEALGNGILIHYQIR